jgi:hypothetical protein
MANDQPIGLDPQYSIGFKGAGGDRRPDLRVLFVIDGKPYEVALWAKTSKNGNDYYSGSAPKLAINAFVKGDGGSQAGPKQATKPSGKNQPDDEIPF